jgi:hypothetical protein
MDRVQLDQQWLLGPRGENLLVRPIVLARHQLYIKVEQ